jgi:hypothetical protein
MYSLIVAFSEDSMVPLLPQRIGHLLRIGKKGRQAISPTPETQGREVRGILEGGLPPCSDCGVPTRPARTSTTSWPSA